MASAMRVEQGPCEPIKGCIREISEPERARVCQRVAVRASESQSGSHREPERARERQGETGRDPVRA